ncbi:phage major capsid protein [Kordiimonas laminariae]|uniref:phage major capsid protein n=1 Tax=Kordiimonas laminariae TaxID=2917717 RepID=UPI001FF1173E|nr:phage major capsid protein [Kordiimonas laminariae]MCK0068047.1 phage major capsid protein [Kordiimonas laminariae]
MDMTDLKSAIDDHMDAAENSIMGLKGRLDNLETELARPGSNGAFGFAADDAEHKTAFLGGFIQKGDDTALKAFEAKALSTGTGGDGGFAVPTVIDEEIEKQLVDLSPLRKIVKVKTIETSDYKRLVNTGGTGSGWVGETGGRTETDTPSLKEVSIVPGEVYANAAATQRALDDMQFDAEAWLQEEVAEEFAVKEAAAIVNGSGTDQPKGFLHADYTATIGKVKTGAAGALQDADVLIDAIHALKSRYRQGAYFVMNSATLAAVRKLKDADGNFIWRAGLIEGQPDMLLGYPVTEVEDMPDMADGAFAIAFGNFERAYTLVERAGVRVLRDPYSNKPYVNFYATKRVGGALVNEDAIKLVEFSA